MKILLAEDTKDLSRAVCAVLEHEGYAAVPAYDGEEALRHIMEEGYDCIVLDIMMPKMDGMQVLKQIRSQKITTPVLMLTAKAEVDDRVAGLDGGADDYLTKPFAMKELLARLRALLRRTGNYDAREMQFEDVTLSAQSLELSCESAVRLSIREFELMQTLMINANRQVALDYLLEHVWSSEQESGADAVWLYISYLKRKLKAVSSKTQILGEKGTGYMLVSGS